MSDYEDRADRQRERAKAIAQELTGRSEVSNSLLRVPLDLVIADERPGPQVVVRDKQPAPGARQVLHKTATQEALF